MQPRPVLTGIGRYWPVFDLYWPALTGIWPGTGLWLFYTGLGAGTRYFGHSGRYRNEIHNYEVEPWLLSAPPSVQKWLNLFSFITQSEHISLKDNFGCFDKGHLQKIPTVCKNATGISVLIMSLQFPKSKIIAMMVVESGSIFCKNSL
jgi:hypothetical protein